VARVKREALLLGRNREFPAAANLLEQYAAALEALKLYDPELDRAIEQLREKAWQLRNRGEQYFTAREQKYFAYEADLGMKGQKSQYNTMQARRTRAPEPGGPSLVSLVNRLVGRTDEFTVAVNRDTAVAGFLTDVFRHLGAQVPASSYGKAWVLRHQHSGRVFDLGSSYAKAHGERSDSRSLAATGITAGNSLEIVPLPRLQKRPALPVIPDAGILLALPGEPGPLQACRYHSSTIACDFLGEVYRLLATRFPPNSYGRLWVLREEATGRVFDCGSSWAKANGVPTDTRPIGTIGVRGGSIVQVVALG
jgi:hypothetical protein